jgi:hypothetical protein
VLDAPRNENHVSGQARASFVLETEIHAPSRNEHDLFVVMRMARRVRARLDARLYCHALFTRDNTLGHRTLIVLWQTIEIEKADQVRVVILRHAFFLRWLTTPQPLIPRPSHYKRQYQ